MYSHIKNYEIKYTDVDAFDNLKLSALLSFLQESACLSADELGFGYDDLTPKHIGFIIVNWYVELKRKINLGEELTVQTWPLPPKHLTFFRDFKLFCGTEQVGACTTRWCMIDTRDFKMLPTTAFFGENAFDDYNTERAIEYNGWKIQKISGDCPAVYSRIVRYSDYDHYFHVNNTKYADFLMDAFDMDFWAGKMIKSAQITYVKQCKYGERLDVYVLRDGEFYNVEGRVGGEVRVQMRVKFDVV